MFLVYVDETGDDGYPAYSSPLFVLTAVYFDCEDWQAAFNDFKDLDVSFDAQTKAALFVVGDLLLDWFARLDFDDGAAAVFVLGRVLIKPTNLWFLALIYAPMMLGNFVLFLKMFRYPVAALEFVLVEPVRIEESAAIHLSAPVEAALQVEESASVPMRKVGAMKKRAEDWSPSWEPRAARSALPWPLRWPAEKLRAKRRAFRECNNAEWR